VVEDNVNTVNDEKWMKATITIVEEAWLKMADIQKRVLAKYGQCWREASLLPLELFHGLTRGDGPKKMRSCLKS
jgi:hypothetical protein